MNNNDKSPEPNETSTSGEPALERAQENGGEEKQNENASVGGELDASTAELSTNASPPARRSWTPQFRLSSFLSLTAVVSIVGAWWFRSAPLHREYADGVAAFSQKNEDAAAKMQGSYHLIDQDGRVMLRGQHLDGKATGPWTSYYESGMRSSSGRVFNGAAIGSWTYWRESGYRLATISYARNRDLNGELNPPIPEEFTKWRQGPAEYWHPNGVRMAKGQFRDNRRHGKWEFWDQEGKPLAEGEFYQGARLGVWSRWKNGEESQRYYVEDVVRGDPDAVRQALSTWGENVRLAKSNWRHDILELAEFRTAALPQLQQALASPEPAAQSASLNLLAKLGGDAKAALPQVRKLLDSPFRLVRRDAAICLFAISPEDQVEALTVLEKSVRQVPVLSAEPFRHLVDKGRLDVLEQVMRGPEPKKRAGVRRWAARILSAGDAKDRLPRLRELLQELESDSDPEVVRIVKQRYVSQQFDGGFF